MDSALCNSSSFINGSSPISHFSRRRRCSISLPRFTREFPHRKHRTIVKMAQNSTNFSSKTRGEGKPISFPSLNCQNQEEKSLIELIRKPIVLVLFCITISFIPLGKLHMRAMAAVPFVMSRDETKGKRESKWKDHEYGDTTRKLLETVSVLLRKIEDVRSSKGDVNEVKAVLKRVKLKSKELEEEIIGTLNADLKVMKEEKESLVKKSEEIIDSIVLAKRKQERLLRTNVGGGDDEVKQGKEEIAGLEEGIDVKESEYNAILDKVDDIEDMMSRRETIAYSIGIRELLFIEKECEVLVDGFIREMKRQNAER
ncbi:hypothetical protein GIB67_039743 [Kingdonia uniflora]|uniref:Uncharacterized protein n=1 Tax=Kingdonia uniflora TaxID=39325 RepID=A0A7J7MQE1_9MAGN|nr:hypothetical protein GIB67_039743 [Kingdonia uniflora]